MIEQYHFPITARYSKRAKRISALVKPEGIEVVLPLNTKLQQAAPLLNQHAHWFLRKWQELAANKQQQKAHFQTWPLQLNMAAIGCHLQIDLSSHAETNTYHLDLQLSDDKWSVYNAKISLGKSTPTKAIVLESIQDWIKDFAFHVFYTHLESASKLMQLPFEKLKINLAKTCWGSCNSKRIIALNASLLFFGLECLEYVIIHECAHLKYMDHSKNFWQLVAKYCPDYAMIKQSLKQKAKELPLWLYQGEHLSLPLDNIMEDIR